MQVFAADVPKLHFKRALTNPAAVTRKRFRHHFYAFIVRFLVSMPGKAPFQTRVNVIVGSNLRLSEMVHLAVFAFPGKQLGATNPDSVFL